MKCTVNNDINKVLQYRIIRKDAIKLLWRMN